MKDFILAGGLLVADTSAVENNKRRVAFKSPLAQLHFLAGGDLTSA